MLVLVESIGPSALGWLPIMVEVLLIVTGELLLFEVSRQTGGQAALAGWTRGRSCHSVSTILLVMHGVTPFGESLTGFGIDVTFHDLDMASAVVNVVPFVVTGIVAAWLASPVEQWASAVVQGALSGIGLTIAAAWLAHGVPEEQATLRGWKSWRQVAPIAGLFIVLGILMAVSGITALLAQALASMGLPTYRSPPLSARWADS